MRHSMELKVVILFLLTIRAVYGQDCESGSFYEELVGSNAVSSIYTGYWYLNLDKPCSCSGEVTNYVMKYYDLGIADYNVHAAMWELMEDGKYHMISSTELLRKNESKRRKRDRTSGSVSKVVGNVFVRKGAVIGVYFKTDETAMPIIGNATAGTYSVCKYQGDIDNSTSINCNSSLIQTDIIIHAKGWIDKLECNNPDGITNGNYELIDADKEYGARVQYTCVTGYEIVGGDEFLTCNNNINWTGTVLTCQIVNCVTVNASINGIIVNMSQGTYKYGDSVSFSCNTGYMIVGNESITCLADGNWSDSTPLCADSSQAMSSDYRTSLNTLALSTASTPVDFNSQLKSINISETSINSPSMPHTRINKTVISATISAQTKSGMASPGSPSTTQLPNSQSGISETFGIGGNNNSPADGSNSIGVAIAAVILVLLAILLSVSVVVLIIFLVMARRRNKRKTFTPETLMKNNDLSSGLTNLVYQANSIAINGGDAGYNVDLTNPVYDGERTSINEATAKPETAVIQASEMKARLWADVDNQDSLYPELQNIYK